MSSEVMWWKHDYILCVCVCQLIVQEQDEQLELVSGSIRVLKDMSGRIGDELDEQAVWVSTNECTIQHKCMLTQVSVCLNNLFFNYQ